MVAFFGFREATVEDGEALVVWLLEQQVPHEQRLDQLREATSGWCRAQHIEPPTLDRLERVIRSALRTYGERLRGAVLERLGPAGLARLDGLIAASLGDGSDSIEDGRSLLAVLKADPGPVGLESVLRMLEPEPSGEMWLRSVRDAWPFPANVRVAPALVAAVDLVDGGVSHEMMELGRARLRELVDSLEPTWQRRPGRRPPVRPLKTV
jgi:hypothetical protein